MPSLLQSRMTKWRAGKEGREIIDDSKNCMRRMCSLRNVIYIRALKLI